MKIPNHLEDQRFGFNMTPMIDVVFLLIIFFLVSMDLVKLESRMEIDLSQADSGLDRTTEPGELVTVNVLDTGEIVVSGRSLTVDQLTDLLRERVAAQGPDLEVRIRASRLVPYGRANPVMLACVEAGIWNFKYAVIQREP